MIICPFCNEEVHPEGGYCPNCETYVKKTKLPLEEFAAENEWTETDWGQDIEELNNTIGQSHDKEVM